MFKRMLAPLDGTELAEKVIPYVLQLTGSLELETSLLHVCEVSKTTSMFMCQSYVNHLVERLSNELKKDKGIIKGCVGEGDVAKSILQFAAKNNSDLILMSKHSDTEQERRLIGNIAHKVLNGTRVPVLIVHPGDAVPVVKNDWPKNILVPLDGSKLSDKVLPYVESLSEQMQFRPEITLLNICESRGLNADYPESALQLTWEEHVRKSNENSARICSMHLDEVQAQLEVKKFKVKSHVILGNKVVDEIIKYSNEQAFDLIAMTTHGYSGISVWPYGHVADHLITLSAIPLLLVRPS